MREIYAFLLLASRLTNPFGHPSQVRTQVLVLQTWLASTCESVWPGFSYMPNLVNRSFKGILLRFMFYEVNKMSVDRLLGKKNES